VQLFRAAEVEGGYFGFNTYWTPSRTYAESHFAPSAGRSTTYRREGLVLWTVWVEVPSPSVLDLRGPVLHFVRFDTRVKEGLYAAEGRAWVIATVEDSALVVVEMAVYLRADLPVEPTPVTA
jgi:hypothetical protein